MVGLEISLTDEKNWLQHFKCLLDDLFDRERRLVFAIAITVFWTAADGKPNMVRAATASSKTSLLLEFNVLPAEVSELPADNAILSFSSTMIRWAAFGPIPFTLFSRRSFSVRIASQSSAGVKAESTVRAVWPPMLDTPISIKKSSRSCRDANPYSW